MEENISNRRSFLSFSLKVGMLLTSGTAKVFGYDLVQGLRIPYEVVFTCKIPKEAGAIESARKTFEDSDRIATINNTFMMNGRILNSNYKRLEDQIVWKYLFRSRRDYKAWNKLVYHDGLFKPSKLPVGSSMDIQKRYLVPDAEIKLG